MAEPLIMQMYTYLCRHESENDAWAMAQRLHLMAEVHYEGLVLMPNNVNVSDQDG